MLLLAVLIAATLQTTAQNPAPTRPGVNPTVPAKETPKQKELRLKLEAARAAHRAARTPEEQWRIMQQIIELTRLKGNADVIASQQAEAEKDAAGKLAFARMNAESERLRAERKARFLARSTAMPNGVPVPTGPVALAASPEPASTAVEPTPVQAQHWSDGIPVYIYVAIGFLGLALMVIWIVFPLLVYRHLRQLVVAQEQTNKLLIIQLEQTRQSSPPSAAPVGAATDQAIPDHPSGEDSAIFTTEF